MHLIFQLFILYINVYIIVVLQVNFDILAEFFHSFYLFADIQQFSHHLSPR